MRYSRNIGVITEEEQELLRSKKVFVAGCGGLGGTILDQLLRIGVGEITIVDPDVFEESNLNRQLLSREDMLGRRKVEAAGEYAAKVNSQIRFQGLAVRLCADNAVSLIKGHDLVMDALDNIESRLVLAKACEFLNIPLIYGAIRGWNLQVSVLSPAEAVEKIQRLYPKGVILEDKSSISFIPSICAGIQSAEGIKCLLGKESDLNGKLLYGDLLYQEWELLPL